MFGKRKNTSTYLWPSCYHPSSNCIFELDHCKSYTVAKDPQWPPPPRSGIHSVVWSSLLSPLNRIQQTWWVATAERVTKRLWLSFCSHSLTCCFWRNPAAASESCPVERPRWHWTEGSLQPQLWQLSPQPNGPWGTDSGQQPCEWVRMWLLPPVSVKRDSSSGWHPDGSLMSPESVTPGKLHQDPDPWTMR